jgi:hypothetical protein
LRPSKNVEFSILIDENSLWLKRYAEVFLSSGIILYFIGDPGMPTYSTPDDEILQFCIDYEHNLLTENGKDFRALLKISENELAARKKEIKVFVVKQKWVPQADKIKELISIFRNSQNWSKLVFVPLGNQFNEQMK